MREEEIKLLKKPYKSEKDNIDRRFNSAIGADLPSATKLTNEIFNDLSEDDFGINWWKSIPKEEKILISDYLYQAAYGIEENLIEAKLHYFGWLKAKEDINKKIVNIVKRNKQGNLVHKMPKSVAPIDDLPNKIEKMHICGFFRAIGSSLDCLGAVIIGVLAIPCDKNKSLRRASFNYAKQLLAKTKDDGTPETKLKIEFRDFIKNVESSCGPIDWINWADQYRNMFVHRGRRIMVAKTQKKAIHIYDHRDNIIPRSESFTHLAKFPDRSDVEAFIKSKEIVLNEDADTTLKGIFDSCQNLNEIICEKLVEYWIKRRKSADLQNQPPNQWDNKIRSCDFDGYDSTADKIDIDTIIGHPTIYKRLISASVTDRLRKFWDKSKWN